MARERPLELASPGAEPDLELGVERIEPEEVPMFRFCATAGSSSPRSSAPTFAAV
jgi:hypothetical protein